MVDIFLYPGEPNPADVKLSDPTVLRGGAGSLDAVVTAGQGSQSVAAVVTIGGASLDAVVTLGQGSQSVAAVASVATSAVVTAGQGSQSVASLANVSTVATTTLGQGSQSVQAAGSISIAASVVAGQGSQSVAAVASVGGGAALDAVVTLGQGSQSVAALATIGVAAPPVTTGGGGIAGTGRVHVLPSRQQDRATDRHHVDKREPFTPLREVKRAEKPANDLKALRDRLLDLGRALERNKQAVKDRIRVEQAKPESPELMAILQLLIDEYELTLYNQNAARLLIILADDR